jgi:phosphoserine phosphatase
MSYVLTLIADRAVINLDHKVINRIRKIVSGGEPDMLSPGEAADIPCPSPPDLSAVRLALEGAPIDAIAVEADERRKRLLIADMDSTIVTGETLDELAEFAGLKSEIAAITQRAMNPELDFPTALRQRVAMLKGLSIVALERTWERITLTQGARDLVATMRTHGAFTVLVSGGFTFFTTRVADLAGFHQQYANTLLDNGLVLTGSLDEPVLDQHAKLAALHSLAAERGLPLSATLAIGDGANDLPMLRDAGLGIAYRPKPFVAKHVPARLDHADLRGALFVQGYRTEDIVSQPG